MSSSKKANYLMVVLVMLVNSLSYGIIIPLIYPYASKFGLDATGFGLLFASFSLAQLIATPIMGRLSDQYGRKPLLLISLLGTSISLALFASASSIWMLFVARILDGITGGNNSVAQAMISDVTTKEDRAKAFGVLGATFGVGFVLGPAVGGILGTINLATPFWFASVLALAATIIGAIILRETNIDKRETKSKDIGIGTIIQALSSESVGRLLLLSLAVFVAQNTMIIGFQSFSVDFLKLSTARIGLIFTLFGLLNVAVQGFGIKWLLTRYRRKKRLVQNLLLLSALFMLTVSMSQGYWFFVISMLIYGLFSSPVGAILTSLISENTNNEDQGGVLGVNQSMMSIGQIVGPLLAALVVAHNVRFSFVLTSLLLFVSFYLCRKLPTRAAKLDL